MNGLVREDVFFDFANDFRRKNEKIGTASQFVVDDKLYEEFAQFVSTKELEYETASEEKLEELIEIAKKEGYYEETEADLAHLQEELEPQDLDELQRSRGLISEFLLTEIVSRYHYQDGRIEASLANDTYISSTLDLFQGSDYTGILSGAVDLKKKD